MVGVLVDQDPALKNAKEEIKIAIGMEGNFILFLFSIYISASYYFMPIFPAKYIYHVFLGHVEREADLDRGHALVREIETHPIELDPDVTSQSKSIHIFLSKCVRSECYKN